MSYSSAFSVPRSAFHPRVMILPSFEREEGDGRVRSQGLRRRLVRGHAARARVPRRARRQLRVRERRRGRESGPLGAEAQRRQGAQADRGRGRADTLCPHGSRVDERAARARADGLKRAPSSIRRGGGFAMRRYLSAAFVAAALALAVVAGAESSARQASGRVQTAINPAVTYSKNCATCHGKDG